MSPLRQILHLALNDLRLTVKDRASFVWMLALPLVFMWIFGQMSSSSPGPRTVTLGVEDRDGGWLARAFIADIADIAELQDGQITLRPLAPGRPEEDAPARKLVIPQGFTAGALAGQQQVLRLEQKAGSNEEFSLAAQAVITRALVRTVARLAETSMASAPGDTLDERARRAAFEAIARRPPSVRVAVTVAGGADKIPVPQGFAQSVPGTLTFFVLMMTTIYGGIFLTLEKRQGMIRRQAMAPLGRGTLFLGKLAGRMLMAAAQIAVYLAAGRFLYGLSWGSSGTGLLLVLGCYAFAVAGYSVLLGALLSTPEQASAVGWLSSMVLGALGGCWWPSELMPRWLWRAAHVFPTAWAMDAFHALISFGRGVEAVLLPSAALLGFGALFAVLGSRFLRYD